MKYHLKIGKNITSAITCNRETGGPIRIETEAGGYDVTYRSLGQCRYLLTVNGKIREAFVVTDREGKQVFVNGRSFHVKDADRLPSRHGRGKGHDDAPGDVTPPMPSVVVRILIQKGDRVEKGQGLVVVSAMKMETTLCAPRAGNVKAIHNSVGDKVAPGEILVEIDQETMKNG